ncbi:NYN domain-containing protein [Pilimelia anulata]|nr:NYN domain-containing protein [Pilimelia anulata]
MALFTYVDNSNVWIEGMRISAVRKGLVADIAEASERGVTDSSWNYSFGGLYEAVCPADLIEIGRAALFGSYKPPKDDVIWKFAERPGFDVVLFERQYGEKQVDVEVALQMSDDSRDLMQPGDKVVLVSGDQDFVPAISRLADRGFPTTVVFWEHATATALREAAADFFPLDPVFDRLTR